MAKITLLDNELEQLTILYLSKQDIGTLSPQELVELYKKTYDDLKQAANSSFNSANVSSMFAAKKPDLGI